MRTVIGVSGAAGSGKDTFANTLVQHLDFTRVAFADAVRDVAEAINPIIYITGYGATRRLNDLLAVDSWDYVKRTYPEARRMLQVIGTEAGRMLVGPDVWVNIVAKKIDALPEDAKVVITDMRFPNEVEFIKGPMQGHTVCIKRPNNPDAIEATHASEKLKLETADFVLINDGTLEDLKASTLITAGRVETMRTWK